MKIACIGAGYVGGPTMAMIAHNCPEIQVFVLDLNKARIDAWNSDKLPIYEPGLDEIVKGCRGQNLFFTVDADKHVADADIIFVSVNTPTKTKGVGAGKSADMTYWEGAARMIAKNAKQDKIVVEKSTVPVKTAEAIGKVLRKNVDEKSGVKFQILSNPEFLAEGTAIRDLTSPDRVLIGGDIDTPEGRKATETLVSVYAHWVPRDRILTANLWSAELSKLTANAFLAQRISSINTISALCEETGADVKQVAKAIGTDSRIGARFLHASVGFGGSCFQKDILNLCYVCQSLGLTKVAKYWESVIEINDYQKERFVGTMLKYMFNTLNKKKVAVYGFAFKKDTGDTRETPAIDVCRALVTEGAQLAVFDPQVDDDQIQHELALEPLEWDAPLTMRRTSDLIQQAVHTAEDAYAAAKDAHAIALLTEWDEFKTLDYQKIYDSMMKPAFVFDGRNILDAEKLRKIGFVVYGIGKPHDSFVTAKCN